MCLYHKNIQMVDSIVAIARGRKRLMQSVRQKTTTRNETLSSLNPIRPTMLLHYDLDVSSDNEGVREAIMRADLPGKLTVSFIFLPTQFDPIRVIFLTFRRTKI